MHKVFLTIFLVLPATELFAHDCGGLDLSSTQSTVADLMHNRTVPGPLQARINWRSAAKVAAGIGALILIDEQLLNAVQQNNTEETHEIGETLMSCDPACEYALAAAVWATGATIRDEELRAIGRESLQATLLAGSIITPVLKQIVGRSRPSQGQGAFAFAPFSGNHSFPSGHAAYAFALASVFSRHSDNRLVPVVAYGLAGGVALARVQQNAHFPSDVAAGALIGIVVGRAVADHSQHQRALDLVPTAIPGGVAIRFRW